MPAQANPRSYDVYLTTGARRFYFRNDNHGITLKDDRIGWMFDGRSHEAPYANIVAVHLRSGGDWRNVIDQCVIDLANRTTLAITNGNSSGLPDETQARIYCDFVRDLHRRLATPTNASIRFTAGYTPGRYRAVLVCAILLGIICVGIPFVLLLITGEFKVFGLLIVGGFLCWPLARMVQSNAPRDYTPDQIPEDLLS